jgi:hypothetical protein
MAALETIEGILAALSGAATETFVELLLDGMNKGFDRSSSYHRNIENFKGSYVFRTEDNRVCLAAVFDGGSMEVRESAPDEWDVCVTFQNVPAFQKFLFSQDHDILTSLLANEVEVDGNLNYIYKFGYMARELQQRPWDIFVEGR